jgi:glycosyltransferase involved in cell wall biosynthesis
LNSNIKNICFINNFNNESFIESCLKSVFNQTRPFDEIIIVDDGSTDRSLEVISHFLIDHKNLQILQKENQGQLSTFNEALLLIPDKAQIFLLDGDDLYPRDYLEATLKAIGRSQWDFAFCDREGFEGEQYAPKSAMLNELPSYYFYETSALVRSRECWIGNATSCISLSSELFKKIFPYPIGRMKKYWADDHLIYISSVLGAEKIYLPSVRIGWRNHLNNITKLPYSEDDIKSRHLAIAKAINWYCDKYCIARYPGILEYFKEYKMLGPHWQKQLDLPNQYRMLNRLLRDLAKQFYKNHLSAVRKIFIKDL